MADANTVLHIGENLPEQVAFKLMKELANVEGRDLYLGAKNAADRKWVLDTYAECLHAVRGYREAS